MNERIQDLGIQAGLYVDLNGSPWPRAMSAEESELAYTKFAQLIVQECADIAKRNGIEPDPYSENWDAQVAAERKAQEIYDEIMSDFGVEL